MAFTLQTIFQFPNNRQRTENRGVADERIRTHKEESSAVLNPLKAQLNPICHQLTLLGAHRILHVSRMRVNLRKFRHCFSLQPHLLRRRGKDLRAGTSQAEGGPDAFHLPPHVPGRRRRPGGSCPGTGYAYPRHKPACICPVSSIPSFLHIPGWF